MASNRTWLWLTFLSLFVIQAGPAASAAQSMDSVATRLTHLETTLQQHEAVIQQQQATIQQQEAIIQQQAHRLQVLEDRARHQVAFGAQSCHVSNHRLVCANVTVNQGGAYNTSDGRFTVPTDGLYFFAASSDANTRLGYVMDHYTMFNIEVDGKRASSYARTTDPGRGETVSVQVVLHLRQGQQVYVALYTIIGHDVDYSSFSGFLIAADM